MSRKCLRLSAAFWAWLYCAVLLPAAAGPESRRVVDSLGRSVRIPAHVRRVLSLQPEITRIIVALGAGPRLAGIDRFLRSSDPLFPIVDPDQSRLPLVSMADYNVNMELVLRLAPDVIFGAPEDRPIVESLQSKTGVPTIALSSMGSFDRLLAEIDLLGAILDRSKRAAELSAYFRGEIKAIQDRVRRNEGRPKPRVYMAFWGSPTRTPVRYEPVAAAGGINVAEGLLPSFLGTLIANVNLERILAWNPDIILVHGNYPPRERTVTTGQFLSDRRLSSIRAVKDKRVHYTFGFWNWWDPAEVLYETAYLARLFHPDLFRDFDAEARGNAVFRKFYGLDRAFAALSASIGCGSWLHER
jgi:iron complex transport system substrate-binding protein